MVSRIRMKDELVRLQYGDAEGFRIPGGPG